MKKMKAVLLILCCVLLLFSSAQITLALASQPTVEYDGKRHEFSFINVNNTDLFPDFKNVVPGDWIVQKINVCVDHCNGKTDMFLRAESADDVMLPEGIMLKVYKGDNLISESSLNSQGALKEGVRLHRFTKDETVGLQVVLEVPTSIGNEISDLRKEVRWIFAVYEYEDAPSQPDSPSKEDNTEKLPVVSTQQTVLPKTGDLSAISIYWILAMGALVGVIVLTFARKKNDQ